MALGLRVPVEQSTFCKPAQAGDVFRSAASPIYRVSSVRLYRILCPVLTTLFLTGCAGTRPESKSAGVLRVLFIGNSYTFYNDLPGMFAELMRAGGYETVVESSAVGGWTLADHAASEQTLGMLESQNWDYVILQEQSVIPCVPDMREQHMYPAVRALDEKIQQAGANTILFMTWGRRDGLAAEGYPDFKAMQVQLYTGYMEIGEEVGAMVAPVGLAWQNGRTADPELELWDRDGSHPSEEGSYLAACVLYAIVCQKSPEMLGYGAGLPEGTAQFLQGVAAETVLE